MISLFELVMALFSVGCSSVAQILLKHGMALKEVQQALASGRVCSVIAAVLLSGTVPIGLFFYGFGAVAWLFVLARVDVSVAYPLMALGFVVTMVLGYLVFGEPITARKTIGAVALIAGVYLIAATP